MLESKSDEILKKIPQNSIIFLWGMPGSGKTTIGKQLAKQLNCDFIDLDDYIIEKENKTISQIFQQQGESHFRNLETISLENIIKTNINNQVIIATGGGTPCFNKNALLMLNSGFCIFLNIDLDILTTRIINDIENKRPLFTNKTNLEIRDFIFNLYENRFEHYKNAHFIVY